MQNKIKTILATFWLSKRLWTLNRIFWSDVMSQKPLKSDAESHEIVEQILTNRLSSSVLSIKHWNWEIYRIYNSSLDLESYSIELCFEKHMKRYDQLYSFFFSLLCSCEVLVSGYRDSRNFSRGES